MKQTVVLILMLAGVPVVLHAQTTQSGSLSSSTAHHAKAKTSVVARRQVPLNNRAIYHWKNGQRATPTGHEATGTASESFVSGRKDSVAPAALKHQ